MRIYTFDVQFSAAINVQAETEDLARTEVDRVIEAMEGIHQVYDTPVSVIADGLKRALFQSLDMKPRLN